MAQIECKFVGIPQGQAPLARRIVFGRRFVGTRSRFPTYDAGRAPRAETCFVGVLPQAFTSAPSRAIDKPSPYRSEGGHL